MTITHDKDPDYFVCDFAECKVADKCKRFADYKKNETGIRKVLMHQFLEFNNDETCEEFVPVQHKDYDKQCIIYPDIE